MVDKEKVREQAKKIMDEFMSALDKAEKIEEDFGVMREDVMRTPGENKYEGGEFKEDMLKNAKKVEDEQIVAEKKKW